MTKVKPMSQAESVASRAKCREDKQDVGHVGRGERGAHRVLEPQALPQVATTGWNRLLRLAERGLRDQGRAEEVYLEHDGRGAVHAVRVLRLRQERPEPVGGWLAQVLAVWRDEVQLVGGGVDEILPTGQQSRPV